LEFLFERVFHFLFSITNSYGLAILLISILMSFVLMPFYHITYILETREKAIRLKLQTHISKINRIKDVQLRHECISKLYKSFGYSPIKSLLSLSSLMIQIPFFIIAYKVLNRILVDNPYSADLSFLCIKNLGVQDALLGGVNLLPILMTLINILSVMLMTPMRKESKQSYVIAVFFLIFLYMSPAGLVLYWTSNNFINLLRYLFIYLEKKGILKVKTFENYFSSLLESKNIRIFLFLVSLYFMINNRLSFSVEYFSRSLLFPFYFLALLKIYDFVIEYGRMYKRKKNIKDMFFSLMKALLIILCITVSIFVKTWEKIDYLGLILILFSIYDYKYIRLSRIKKLSKYLMLPIVAMLFPAVLYATKNILYFNNHFEILKYFTILMAISCFLPLVTYIFNNRLSITRVIRFSTAFILAAMFLVLIREITKYVGTTPIDFVLLFAIFLFILDLFKKSKKILIIFLLSASFSVLLTYAIKSVIKKAKIEPADASIIFKDLYKIKMQDTPAIYLFMHDAFPHRDLIKKLGLDVSLLDILLKKYDFIEYNVYSLFCYTMPTMSSTFNMKKEHIKGDWPDGEEMEYLRASLGGNNIISKILSDNGYRNYVSLSDNNNNGEKYFFGESPTSEIIESHIRSGRITLLHAIRCGTIHTFEKDSTSMLLGQWASHANNEGKILAWGVGYPGHGWESGNEEYEIKELKERYNFAMYEIKKELESTIANNPDAIVILMSDHGPWVLDDTSRLHWDLNNDAIQPIHFRDSYGAFMAIRWPDKERAAKYDKEFNITQDLFPIVLAYLYDSPIPLKYKIEDTAVRIKDHKFDKGVFYPYFYKKEWKKQE
jgi:YidC/Oxa1 family membrane protein insertase